MMAAGAVTLAHDSGGPQMDIVTEYEGKPTGFRATDTDSYANKMAEILDLGSDERMAIRQNGRASVHRFSEDNFEKGFLKSVSNLIAKKQ